MSWLAAIGSVGAGFASVNQTRAAGEANAYALAVYRSSQQAMAPYSAFTPAPTRRNKCDSCGSREFRQHNGQTVCSYCRSGA